MLTGMEIKQLLEMEIGQISLFDTSCVDRIGDSVPLGHL